jgi:hypothetical protein
MGYPSGIMQKPKTKKRPIQRQNIHPLIPELVHDHRSIIGTYPPCPRILDPCLTHQLILRTPTLRGIAAIINAVPPRHSPHFHVAENLLALQVVEAVVSRDANLLCDKYLAEEVRCRGDKRTPKDGDAGADAGGRRLETGHDDGDWAVPRRIEGRVGCRSGLDGGRKPPDGEDVDAVGG